MLDDLIGHIVCADCLTVLKDIPDESIDLVCTDCPYHIVSGGCTNIPRKDEPSGIFNRRLAWNADNAKSGKLFDHNEIKFEQWLPEVYRVLKNGTHCYIMINARNLADLQTKAENVGFAFQHKSAVNVIPQFAPFVDFVKTDYDLRSITPPAFAQAFYEANNNEQAEQKDK